MRWPVMLLLAPSCVCQNYKSETGCTYGNKCFVRHDETDEKPTKKSKKGGAKGSVVEGVFTVGVVCLMILIRKRPSLWKEGKLRSNHAVRFSKGTWHQIKIME